MKTDVTGVILAGGQNRRIGKDKAFLPVGNEPIIERQLKIFRGIFKEIIIVTNSPDKYRQFDGVKIITDIVAGQGPLGGIYSALIAANTEYIFVAACDMPFLNRDALLYIIDQAGQSQAVVPRCDTELHPLCAMYTRSCIPAIKQQLSQGNFMMKEFLKRITVRFIEHAELKELNADGMLFTNINTLEDYSTYQKNA